MNPRYSVAFKQAALRVRFRPRGSRCRFWSPGAPALVGPAAPHGAGLSPWPGGTAGAAANPAWPGMLRLASARRATASGI